MRASLAALAMIGLLATAGTDGALAAPGIGPDTDARASLVGDGFRDRNADGSPCPLCPVLVEIPAGRFVMGAAVSEFGSLTHERPRHQVRIPAPLAVGKYEVTFEEWDACARDGGCDGYRPKDFGWGRGKRPVVAIDWVQAVGYTRWLSRKTGKRYRLPTEAEWEYFARAGTRTPFSTGRTIEPDEAAYDVRYAYAGGRLGRYRKGTRPVGSFAPNPFGLYDVHGNVAEWVADRYDRRAYREHTSYPEMVGEMGVGFPRVARGGSWLNFPGMLRSAYRYTYWDDMRLGTLGFRVLRETD